MSRTNECLEAKIVRGGKERETERVLKYGYTVKSENESKMLGYRYPIPRVAWDQRYRKI